MGIFSRRATLAHSWLWTLAYALLAELVIGVPLLVFSRATPRSTEVVGITMIVLWLAIGLAAGLTVQGYYGVEIQRGRR
jgi:hypothetical protein